MSPRERGAASDGGANRQHPHVGQAPFGAGETPVGRHAREGTPDELRARDTAVGQLSERGIDTFDGDTDDQIADLLSAVEQFEHAVSRRGGDSFTNSADSSRPQEQAFVMPRRAADESAPTYISRLERATQRVGGAPIDTGDASAVGRARAVDDRGEAK